MEKFIGQNALINLFFLFQFIILSVLLDVTEDIPNAPLEMFIREWEEEAKKKQFLCSGEGVSLKQYNSTHERPGKSEMKDIWGSTCSKKGCSQGSADWNVYSFILMFWYCGYKG